MAQVLKKGLAEALLELISDLVHRTKRMEAMDTEHLYPLHYAILQNRRSVLPASFESRELHRFISLPF